jgi:signal transduction histidine kinase
MAADRGPRRRIRPLAGSVRFRVTALATLAVLAVLVVTGTGLVAAQRGLLTDNVEEAVTQRADELTALVAGGGLPGALVDSEGTLSQVVTADGRVLAASASIAGAPALGPPPPEGRTEVFRTVHDLPTDTARFRLLTRRVQRQSGTVLIHVAGALDDVDQSSGVLAAVLAVAFPAAAVLLAALVWNLVGRTLRPVEAIRTEVAAIGGTDLHHRVPEPGGGDEIDRLARTMNAMLDRVEDATARQQRFVADASHELRSPLTRIRSELEVDLAHPGTARLAATHRSILDETLALQRLIEDLLHLARSDAGASTARRVPVDLDDIVLHAAARLRAEGRVEVDSTAVSAAQVHGDPDQLSRTVRNLTDNAARHARGTVTLTLAERDHTAVLSVADDGPGIPAEQHDRVFERFARLDEARTATAGGTGLGLAITRDIIRRHHGSIAIDPTHHPGTRFVVTLPTAPDGRSPARRRGHPPDTTGPRRAGRRTAAG